MTETTLEETQSLEKQAYTFINQIRTELQKAMIGQEAVIDEVLIALLAGGHVLLEGVPGLGKTLLVRTLAHCFNGEFARIQFTPDLMPSDITGHAIYDLKNEQFSLQKGPIFTNLLLADEINRAPAKTQSALLEVMQEEQATIEGKAEAVPKPFMVLATQNPLEQEGTYPLPEAQLDRFMFKLYMDYPSKNEEIEMVKRVMKSSRGDILASAKLRRLMQPKTIMQLQQIAQKLFIDDQVVDYAVQIVRTTREDLNIVTGAGPRASIALIQGGRAKALMSGRDFVTPDDIKACVLPTLRHRIQVTPKMEIENITVDQILQEMLVKIPAPRL